MKEIPVLYKDFQIYYADSFRNELNALFRSYCDKSDGDIYFLGFNRDHLFHMDMIRLNQYKRFLDWPAKNHMVWFSLGLWSLAVSDIAVYSFFPQYLNRWESKTGYPKFTGWNYYADSPRHVLALLTDLDDSVSEGINTFLGDVGDLFINEISHDITELLQLSEQEQSFMKDFLSSWSGMDTNGMSYDERCFLR